MSNYISFCDFIVKNVLLYNCATCLLWFQGYDMEDAMIINKASHERGFAQGMIYKTEDIDLSILKVPSCFGKFSCGAHLD